MSTDRADSTDEAATQSIELIEGLENGEDGFGSDYPIDTMLIRNDTRTVHDVLRRIETGSFVMDPEFQRDFVWPNDKQSKLIESVLMRIPLPVFYLAEDTDGRMVVVDGLQRLSTFQRFVHNKLRLDLRNQTALHKKRFSDLAPKLQNRVEDCNLILYVIDSKVPERARLDIFERVNGGVPLTRQQMRNCLYSGLGTRFLKDEAMKPLFIDATGGSLDKQTMRDREFVNRFCAFTLLRLDLYKGDMDEFLAEALKTMNKLGEPKLNDLSIQLHRSLSNNLAVFERHAFRKHNKDQERRSILNASLWDVMATGLAHYSKEIVEKNKDRLLEGFYELMGSDEFVESITYGTNDTKKVSSRFALVKEMLKRTLSD